MPAAELAGDYVVVDDELAEALLSTLASHRSLWALENRFDFFLPPRKPGRRDYKA